MPSVSILMPFHDAAETLDECLTSIECQTFEDWELVAVDDGSEDGSTEIVNRAAQDDSRIRLVSQGRIGLVDALNLGLEKTRAPFVARMDADDLMRPTRLEAQVARIDEDPTVSLVSCQVRLFPEEEIQAGYEEYIRWQNSCLTNDDVACDIYVESPFAHPSVIFRRDAVLDVGGYFDGEFPEDYELWLRLFSRGHRMEKIPGVLLDWRESAVRLSRTDSRYSREAFDRLRARYLAYDPRVRQKRELVFWGAGRKTRQRTRHLRELGLEPAAYIDIDPKKIGRQIDGRRVHDPVWLDQSPKPFVLSWVTNHGARELIAARLEELEYRNGEDWLAIG